ncbi:MAG: cupin domain-containing protein [Fidelibacterota bacterium]
MNFYETFNSSPSSAFHPVKALDSMTVGASRIEGRWPYAEYSRHSQDEIVVVISGTVEVEYDDGEKVVVSAGEIEEMRGGRGHKVHQTGKTPADVLLIFPRR